MDCADVGRHVERDLIPTRGLVVWLHLDRPVEGSRLEGDVGWFESILHVWGLAVGALERGPSDKTLGIVRVNEWLLRVGLALRVKRVILVGLEEGGLLH